MTISNINSPRPPDEELEASLQAIEEAMADLKAGRTIPLNEAKRLLEEKYGLQS